MIKELDDVVLRTDFLEHGLTAGDVGTVAFLNALFNGTLSYSLFLSRPCRFLIS